MFAPISLNQPMLSVIVPDAGTARRRNAAAAFEKAYARGLRQQRWGGLFGRQKRLLDLNQAERFVSPGDRSDAGVRLVSLSAIRGSEGRVADFDADFNPLQEHTRERWIGVAAAAQSGVSLPPVKLVQIGEVYYVRDGHHRISVARQRGQKEIEAEVSLWRAAEAG